MRRNANVVRRVCLSLTPLIHLHAFADSSLVRRAFARHEDQPIVGQERFALLLFPLVFTRNVSFFARA
jgi:hypothetical protein